MEIKIFISGSVPSSKNSKVFTGKFLVWSKAAQKYRKESKQQYLNNKDLFISQIHEFPIRCSIKFIRGTHHKFDLINPTQTLFDLLVEYQWISDDNADIIIPVYEKYEYDKEKPGVIIKIL
jgi:hypothetical protein